MKNLIFTTKFVAMSLLIVVFISCNPEDGEIGPAGPAGTNGTNGTNGTDGQDGNANVIASDWAVFQSANWGPQVSEFGLNTRNYPVTASEVSQTIIDSGVVLVYAKFNGYDDAILQMPLALGSSRVISFLADVSSITIKQRHPDGSSDTAAFGAPDISTNQYRYVIIPSSNTTKSAGLDFTKMSYEEVMDHLELDY